MGRQYLFAHNSSDIREARAELLRLRKRKTDTEVCGIPGVRGVNEVMPGETMTENIHEHGKEIVMSRYDVIIIGAGPGGIFAAYELSQKARELKVAVFEAGNPLEKRKCPIDGKKVKSCINCKTCAIMSGFGGAGAFSDGKYNITNDFGGTLYEYIGKEAALDLMHYVDEINVRYGGEGTKMYSTAGDKVQEAVHAE